MDGAGKYLASAESEALIGPNAIWQVVEALDRHLGRSERDRVMALAGVEPPPPSSGMVPQSQCRAVHETVRLSLGAAADGLLWQAGLSTADYILAHRIPRPAQVLIGAVPGWSGARLLAAAIARHAWTFAGSGRFLIASHRPLTFEIWGNPLCPAPTDHRSGLPACHWHRAVFERLFARLVWPDVAVEEVSCAALGPGPCRFVLHPRGKAGMREKTVNQS